MVTYSATDDVLDDGLDAMKAAVNALTGKIVVCEGAPASYAEAAANKGSGSGKALAGKANPTLTIADDTSGRKCTISAESGIEIDISGTADHVALIDSANSKLWYVTPCDSQVLVSGGTVDLPAWKINVKDPVALPS